MGDEGYSPNIWNKNSKTALRFRAATLRVRVISKRTVYAENIEIESSKRVWFISTFAAKQEGQRKRLTKSRGISADIQSPRTKLLYFIYSAPSSRIKAEPGVKSSMSSALGYKSDGHFHYDWNYLINASMIEEKQGYFLVTDTGKREFALQSTAAMSNSIMVVMGIAMIIFTIGLSLEILPKESVAFFGAALIFIGSLFLVVGRRNKPELTLEAKALLKELSRH